MCGGSKEPYDSYKSGDFAGWQKQFNTAQAIREKQARGEITPEQAQQQLAGIGDLSGLENTIKSDPSGAMELREAKRQGDVSLGRIGIDKSFSRFDDGYYNQYRDTYTNNYFPELDRQFGEVVDKTTASLAGRGMLESTVGINKFAGLQREKDTAKTGIASEAMDASNKLRGQVENSKSNLYSLNEASANPQAMNAQAIGQAFGVSVPADVVPAA